MRGSRSICATFAGAKGDETKVRVSGLATFGGNGVR